jgi:hypothetical protein
MPAKILVFDRTNPALDLMQPCILPEAIRLNRFNVVISEVVLSPLT